MSREKPNPAIHIGYTSPAGDDFYIDVDAPYSPDILDDMIRQMMEAYRLATWIQSGVEFDGENEFDGIVAEDSEIEEVSP